MTRLAKGATRAKLRGDIAVIVRAMFHKDVDPQQVKDVADWIENRDSTSKLPPHGDTGEYIRRAFASCWSQYRGLPE